MFLLFAFIVLLLFMAALSVAMGLLMLLAVGFVAITAVTLIIAALSTWDPDGSKKWRLEARQRQVSGADDDLTRERRLAATSRQPPATRPWRRED